MSASAGSDSKDGGSEPVIVQWILDTRSLWPKATKTKDLEHEAGDALSLLLPQERAAVLRYVYLRDAKLSLASHLLKRHVVVRRCNVSWAEAAPSRDESTFKPFWRHPVTGAQPLHFNVSHQAGIIALLAVYGYGEVDVGVDVVCTSERRERDVASLTGSADGWDTFVDVHSEVFSPREVTHLKTGLRQSPSSPSSSSSSAGSTREELADFRLRNFYALWCLREAYIKMTGEALMAPWLRQLEFRQFKVPVAAEAPSGNNGRTGLVPGTNVEGDGARELPGTVVRDHEIYVHGERVRDVNVCLKSLGPDYMVCAAVRTPKQPSDGLGWRLGDFKAVSLDDVLESGDR